MIPLNVPYDGACYAKGTDLYDDWNRSFTQERIRDLESFVAEQITGYGPAHFVSSSEGSYNRVLRFHFDLRDDDVAFKFPKPGHTAAALAEEKIATEAAWMQFLSEKTNIPIPKICIFSKQFETNPSPLGLPYILMDWVRGESLRGFLRSDDSTTLRLKIYKQIASFDLDLYQLPLKRIGSVSTDKVTGEWDIANRPLTVDMHQFALGIHKFPTDHWPSGPLESSKEYFDLVFSQHECQLWSLRNLNDVQEGASQSDDAEKKMSEVARRRYQARYGFKYLMENFYCEKDDKFCAFNPDLDLRNMLVDSKTGHINGLVDFEVTNAMPDQFTCDPPLWLFRVLPDSCLEKGYMPWFQREYEPIVEEFLCAMEDEEEKRKDNKRSLLSARMRESWGSGKVWLYLAAHHTDLVDDLYWQVFIEHEQLKRVTIPKAPESEIEKYLKHSRNQIATYNKEWASFLGEDSIIP